MNISKNHPVLQRNAVRVTGEGNHPLMFAHGFGFSQEAWNELIPFFEKNYRIILFDYTGSGRSDKSAYASERYTSIDGYAQDIIDICDALGVQNISFVGHSVSSMAVAAAATKRPELFRDIVMIGPSPRFINEPGYQGGFDQEDIDEMLFMMEKNFMQWAQYLAPLSMQNDDRPELTASFEATLLANDEQIAREFAQVAFCSDMRTRLPDLTVPTCILQPLHDPVVPVHVGEYVNKLIPNSTLVILDASGHNPHISHPEETMRPIQQFLTESSRLS